MGIKYTVARPIAELAKYQTATPYTTRYSIQSYLTVVYLKPNRGSDPRYSTYQVDASPYGSSGEPDTQIIAYYRPRVKYFFIFSFRPQLYVLSRILYNETHALVYYLWYTHACSYRTLSLDNRVVYKLDNYES